MTKKEIIKFLDKEIGLFTVNEDEDSLGDIYITDMEFKELNQIIIALKNKIRSFKKQEKKLIKKIKANNGNYIDLSHEILRDKILEVDGDLFILNPRSLIITNCSFITKDFKYN